MSDGALRTLADPEAPSIIEVTIEEVDVMSATRGNSLNDPLTRALRREKDLKAQTGEGELDVYAKSGSVFTFAIPEELRRLLGAFHDHQAFPYPYPVRLSLRRILR